MDDITNQNQLPTVPHHTHNGIDSPTLFPTQPAVAAPVLGATIDAEARTAINAIITALERLRLLYPN